ncbi:hypothetical protein DEMA109039_20590 [Deinococcus marmoris]
MRFKGLNTSVNDAVALLQLPDGLLEFEARLLNNLAGVGSHQTQLAPCVCQGVQGLTGAGLETLELML